jgi:hypothetical protein
MVPGALNVARESLHLPKEENHRCHARVLRFSVSFLSHTELASSIVATAASLRENQDMGKTGQDMDQNSEKTV